MSFTIILGIYTFVILFFWHDSGIRYLRFVVFVRIAGIEISPFISERNPIFVEMRLSSTAALRHHSARSFSETRVATFMINHNYPNSGIYLKS